MAKRRSLTRRWSRKSGNSSAFLNDDTNVVEEDSMYWQYLNTTDSRPPSGTNVTAATAVLEPDSAIIDPNMSDWEYLQKYNDGLPQLTPKDTSEANSNNTSKKEKFPEETSLSESEDSAALHKKKVNLRKSRRPNPQEMFAIDSSDSEPNPPLSSQSQRTQRSPTRSPSQLTAEPISLQDSSSSLETEKVQKQRAYLKKTGAKLLQKSLVTSGDDSVVGPSQQTRTTSIKPRTTYLKRSPEQSNPNPSQPGRDTVQENTDSGSEELVSQSRKPFRRVRKPKELVNPFTAILDETEDTSKIEETEKFGSSRIKTKEDNSNNFALRISPVDSESQYQDAAKGRPSKRQTTSRVSSSSISQEMITPHSSSERREQLVENVVPNREEALENAEEIEDDEDFDDFHSFEGDNENNQHGEPSINDRNDIREDEVAEISPKSAEGKKGDVVEEYDEEISVDEHETPQPEKSKSTPLEEISEDSGDEPIFVTKGNTSAQLLKHKSVHGETSQSPIISGSIAEQASIDSGDQSSGEPQPPEPKKPKLTRSSRSKSVKSPIVSKPTDTSENSKHEISINTSQIKSTQSLKLQRSQIEPQEETASDDELDIETISDDESIFSPKSINNTEKITEELKQPKTSVPAESKEIRITSRPGPRSFKIRSASPADKAASLKSRQEPQKGQKRSRSGRRSSGISSQFPNELPSTQNNLLTLQTEIYAETNEDSKIVEEVVMKRPGPKSFKISQRSILLASKTSEKIRLSIAPSKTYLESQQALINEEESLSESSMQKNLENRRKTDPSAYELPERDRSPSISISESDVGSSKSRTPAKNQRPTALTETNIPSPISHTKKLKKVGVDTDEKELQPSGENTVTSPSRKLPAGHSASPHVVIGKMQDMEPPINKKRASTRVQSKRKSSTVPLSSSELIQRHPLSPQVIIEHKDDNNPSPENITAPMTNPPRHKTISSDDKMGKPRRRRTPTTVPEVAPTRSPLQPKNASSTTTSAIFLAAEKRKMRQLKIDALMKSQKNQPSQRTQEKSSGIPCNTEEFHKKLVEIKEKIRAQSTREEEIERQRVEKQKVDATKKKGIFPKATEKRKTEKVVDKAYIVNGKVYKRPKLSRPKHWATNKLYKFLWKKMEPKFGLETRVRSEKFVKYLAESVTVITRRKKYDHYKDELDALLKKMAQLRIIKNRFEFNGFCYDFLPYEFRVKVVPMLQFGNTHNIPFEPDKLMVPILEGEE